MLVYRYAYNLERVSYWYGKLPIHPAYLSVRGKENNGAKIDMEVIGQVVAILVVPRRSCDGIGVAVFQSAQGTWLLEFFVS